MSVDGAFNGVTKGSQCKMEIFFKLKNLGPKELKANNVDHHEVTSIAGELPPICGYLVVGRN